MSDSLLGLDVDLPGRDSLVLVASVLLVALYAHPPMTWGIYPVAIAALLIPDLRRHWLVWTIFGLLLGAASITYFDYRDDHQFLFTYWMVALAFATAAGDDERPDILAFNARALLILTFGLAAFWKVSSPEFMDGTLFKYVLECDVRADHLATLLTGLDAETIRHNAALVAEFRESTPTGDRVTLALDSAPDVWPTTRWMAAGAALVETAIPLLFLLPRQRRWIRRSAHGALILFICTTYLVVPVVGFASILAILGLALCRDAERRLQLAYTALFILVPVFAAVV